LLITVDTVAAHLAGALAKPVWVLVPGVPDWRWLLGRDDSPWYPSARLFRQPVRGDWDSVALSVRKALDERTGAVPERPGDAQRFCAQAEASLKARDFAAAEDALKSLLALDPMLSRAWHSLGVIAQNRGDQATAAGLFRRALALAPNAA